MKTLKIAIAALLVIAPLCFANAAPLALSAPLTDAGPDGVHPAQLSLPGVVSDVAVAMDTQAEPAKSDAPQKQILHPSLLSLEGELVEDVLVPDERKATPADLLALGR